MAVLFLGGAPLFAEDHSGTDPASDPVRVATANGVANHPSVGEQAASVSDCVPDWVADATFYQIFPERFRNGDPSNDPTRESLEFVDKMSTNWKVTPWGSDWFTRSEWEKEQGDSFYENGVFDRRYGGDLQGVLDKLSYIEDLGVNTIYLNPVFFACSLHKYDGNTYHHVDPYFGPDPAGDLALIATETSDPATWKWTAADKLFLKLIEASHARGMRLILDGVFNHTGRDFFAFKDLCQNQETSPYRDWYLVQSFDDPTTEGNEFVYRGWWGVDTLPEFADTADGKDLHPGPKQYVFDATSRWMDPNGDGDPSDGIDGWRLDVATEVPVKFWHDWNAHVRSMNPEAYTVAEHWEDAAGFLKAGGFSATMNYHGFAWPVKGFIIDGRLSPTDMGRMLVERMEEYPAARQYAMQNLIDSHDTDRVASMVVNASTPRPYLQPDRFDYDVSERVSPRQWADYDLRKPNDKERRIQRMVMVMQTTFVGAPMIYYGTESGMWGADDPGDRMPMVWEDIEYTPQASSPNKSEADWYGVAFDKNLYQFYRAAFALRHQFAPLRRGDFEVVLTDDDAKGLAYRRTLGDETLYVFFNRGNEPWQADLVIDSAEQGTLSEVFTASGNNQGVELQVTGDSVSVTLPPLEAVVVLHRK